MPNVFSSQSACSFLFQQSDPVASVLAGLLGIVLGPINALLGVGCSPISVIGVGGNSCSANPVCCTNNAVVRIRIYALNNYDLIFVDS